MTISDKEIQIISQNQSDKAVKILTERGFFKREDLKKEDCVNAVGNLTAALTINLITRVLPKVKQIVTSKM